MANNRPCIGYLYAHRRMRGRSAVTGLWADGPISDGSCRRRCESSGCGVAGSQWLWPGLDVLWHQRGRSWAWVSRKLYDSRRIYSLCGRRSGRILVGRYAGTSLELWGVLFKCGHRTKTIHWWGIGWHRDLLGLRRRSKPVFIHNDHRHERQLHVCRRTNLSASWHLR